MERAESLGRDLRDLARQCYQVFLQFRILGRRRSDDGCGREYLKIFVVAVHMLGQFDHFGSDRTYSLYDAVMFAPGDGLGFAIDAFCPPPEIDEFQKERVNAVVVGLRLRSHVTPP
jgi:hypothetical protein